MSGLRSPFFWFVLALLTTAALTALGPDEQALGASAPIVYLNGAWMLTAEVALALSATTGFFGILFRKKRVHSWSVALGRTGLFFWVIYLPLSVWAIQADWNALFVSESRFRLEVIMAAIGILLQLGLTVWSHPTFTSLFNVLFFVALWISLSRTPFILHPSSSPVFIPGILSLQLFYIGILFLTMASAYFMTRWWLIR
jgi:hypothetical protein